MTTRTHHLKTWPAPFAAIWSGRKCHEIRYDDRGYAVGDSLVLLEYEPEGTSERAKGYTGRKIEVSVTYVSSGGTWGLPPNLCVMSIDVDNLVDPS